MMSDVPDRSALTGFLFTFLFCVKKFSMKIYFVHEGKIEKKKRKMKMREKNDENVMRGE